MNEELTQEEQKELLYRSGVVRKRIGDIERLIYCDQGTGKFLVTDQIITQNITINNQVKRELDNRQRD
jgi:hypothetical protein